MIRQTFITLASVISLMLVASCGADPRPRTKKMAPPPPAEPKPNPGATGEDRALPAIQAFIDKSKIVKSNEGWRKSLPKPEEAVYSRDRKYFWILETSKGELKIRLWADKAPMHATSAVYLTLLGFYDGLTIHRVHAGSTFQGGCPVGDGTGMPGYLLNDEIKKGQDHDRAGLVSAANRGPSTDGCQFMITLAVPAEDKRRIFNSSLTIFGEVTAGAETLKAIDACGSKTGDPSEKITITRATVSVE